ncbi:alkaline phosphatase family protein (plasmid) [Sinorhizobium meliloti]|nr:alkaline phosphatase family protein [Sinorhizobium meliloti]WQP29274.1 alkaline phosphatase family protein [Sinorhizobium meliloti]
MKFLIASFDGLRPDLISKELTPNIARVQELGVTLARHNTVYPSETRAAFPSLVTGAAPVRHGMVGNKFVDRKSTPERYIDTSDAVLLDRLNKESGGSLMTAPTLGELLAASGKSLAVLATNTPGTTRLFHHKAEDFGHIRLSGHFPEACTPEDALAQIETEFGKLPPAAAQGEPDYSGQEWITSVFLDYVWPRLSPDVAILSYGEPDTTSHFHGTGSATTREIIAYCDAQFGRVLEWWEAEGRSAGIQLILASDHGHITAHTRVSVMDDLRAAGFAPGRAPEPDVDVVVVPGQVGALYLRDRSVDQVSRLVEAMMDQPWCGPIFTSPRNEVEGIAPGSFASRLVLCDHDRAPDVYFAFRADDGIDQFGLGGGAFYDNDRIAGLGVHGGLHAKELAAVGLVAGSHFRGDGSVSAIPSGICDLAPTILHGLGLAVPSTMTGRVLREVFAGATQNNSEPHVETEEFEAGLGSFRQTLQRNVIDGTVYLAGGTASNDATATRKLEAAE